MSDYKHGVFIQEQPTALLPPRRISAGLPVVVGTAPVHTVEGQQPIEEPKLIYSYQEFVNTFGYSDDFASYTLCEFARVFLGLYGVAPAVFVNVLDPASHKTSLTAQDATFDDEDIARPVHPGILTDPILKSSDETVTYVKDTDYSINLISGVISRLSTGSIAAEASVKVTYDYVDPSKVINNDIIGGIDETTGAKTGLELVSEVFPRFRLVPGQIAAPGWSQDPAVGVVMGAKAENINGSFKAVALVDVPITGTGAPKFYREVPKWTVDYNYTDRQMAVCWPKLTLGKEEHWFSSHLAGLICSVDADQGDVPYKSPSNERLEINGVLPVDGEEVWLGPEEASYLNGQGIITALNFSGGWKCWGNRTGAYPGSTDVKDTFVPIRRMFNWVGNTLVLTWWQRLDYPITRRNIETIVDSVNVWLNGLTAREYILGGRVEFREDENPITDVMDGIIKLHVYLTPPSPAREIDFILEYDPAYIQSLFA